MSAALAQAASLVEAEAAQTRAQIEAERSDGLNKLVLLAEFTALVKVGRALRAASAIEAATAGETVQHGSTEGESATRQGDAHPIPCDPTTPKQEGPNV